jgi:hypothetical protein
MLASNPDNTVAKLSVPSGAVQQLIQETEKAVQELATERAARLRLEDENTSLRSAERREIYTQVGRFIAAVLYLCMVGGLVWLASVLGGGITVVGLALLASLGGAFILDRSISQFGFRWGTSQVGLSRKASK